MKLKYLILNLFAAAVIFAGFGAMQTLAQPSDAQIKKDVGGGKAVSVILYKPGKRVWSSTYTKYVWEIGFQSKLKTDTAGVFVIVTGTASYDIIGGRYVYWRTFVSENSYEGIPNPNADVLENLIEKFGQQKIMMAYFYKVEGEVESIKLAEKPLFEWHTPNSVSFNVVAIYKEKGDGYDAPPQRLARTFRVRIYRDDVKGEWLRLVQTANDVEVKKL